MQHFASFFVQSFEDVSFGPLGPPAPPPYLIEPIIPATKYFCKTKKMIAVGMVVTTIANIMAPKSGV